MKISVVIPAYNEEKFIGRCLEALHAQTEKADEIIVVNNNSTDKTVEIAKKFPVRIINETKQGMIYARNAGFDAATNEILARIDADTLVPPGWIAEIKEHFAQDHNLIGLSGPTDFEDNKFNHLLFFEAPTHLIWKLFFGHDLLYGPNTALTKSGWEKIRKSVCLNDKDVHEDFDLALHLGQLVNGKIWFDKRHKVVVSERRWREAKSYWEYPLRFFKTIAIHKLPR